MKYVKNDNEKIYLSLVSRKSFIEHFLMNFTALSLREVCEVVVEELNMFPDVSLLHVAAAVTRVHVQTRPVQTLASTRV